MYQIETLTPAHTPNNDTTDIDMDSAFWKVDLDSVVFDTRMLKDSTEKDVPTLQFHTESVPIDIPFPFTGNYENEDGFAKFPEYKKRQAPPLLASHTKRFMICPIKNPNIFKMYRAQEVRLWNTVDIPLAAYVSDLKQLGHKACDFVCNVIAAGVIRFSSMTGIVQKTETFMAETDISEARCFLDLQRTIENTHMESFTVLFENLSEVVNIDLDVIVQMSKSDYIRDILEWISTHLDENLPLRERLSAMVAYKSILGCGSYYVFCHPHIQGLEGVRFCIQNICKDNSLHASFACLLRKIDVDETLDKIEAENKPSDSTRKNKTIESMVTELVIIELKFNSHLFSSGFQLGGVEFQKSDVFSFVYARANEVLVALDNRPIFGLTMSSEEEEFLPYVYKETFGTVPSFIDFPTDTPHDEHETSSPQDGPEFNMFTFDEEF